LLITFSRASASKLVATVTKAAMGLLVPILASSANTVFFSEGCPLI